MHRHVRAINLPMRWWFAMSIRCVVLALAAAILTTSIGCGVAQPEDSNDQNIATPFPNPTPQALTDLQTQARMALAERLSVPANALKLVSDEVVQWPDTSLGCPEAGMAYAQVIVPGHRITFDHDGRNYEVHTAGEGSDGTLPALVSCEGGISY